LLTVGDIADHGTLREFGRKGLEGLRVDVTDHHPRPFAHEGVRDRTADPVRARADHHPESVDA
jgi:hypothetical protein